jgi:hypothetical protein
VVIGLSHDSTPALALAISRGTCDRVPLKHGNCFRESETRRNIPVRIHCQTSFSASASASWSAPPTGTAPDAGSCSTGVIGWSTASANAAKLRTPVAPSARECSLPTTICTRQCRSHRRSHSSMSGTEIKAAVDPLNQPLEHSAQAVTHADQHCVTGLQTTVGLLSPLFPGGDDGQFS